MSYKQKLELTWIGKENQPRLEPRILMEDLSISYHSATRQEDDLFENILIQGDNLLGLKAIQDSYQGKVNCIVIDPPYNTGSAFQHYDDGVEHSIWLSLMRDRTRLLWELLSDTGSLWVMLDDNESHYFKVMCDEIFGRKNFVANVVWQKKYAPGNNEKGISSVHDHILCWAKNKPAWNWNLLSRTTKQDSLYRNPDNDPRGPWMSDNLTRAEFRERDFYPIKTPSGKDVWPPNGRSWSRPPAEIERLRKEGRLWFGPKGDSGARLKRFLSEVQSGMVARTIWPREEIIEIASKPGGLILDSFAGSGTTGAVAHKMGRRWIMIESGEHAITHIVPRMRSVVEGADDRGITEALGWKGGGGFRFYRLAPSLLERDTWGNWVISKEYNAAMLAEATCKHMGFIYAPSQDGAEYWNHGFSSEQDFIHVTTQAITHGMMAALSNDVGPDRHLLICCKAYSGSPDAFENLTLRKIPQAVLANCEWGQNDYSLRVAALPVVETAGAEGDGVTSRSTTGQGGRSRRSSGVSGQPSFFETPASAGK